MAAGLSPRNQRALMSDLEAAAILAWHYDTPTESEVLRKVCCPSTFLFERQFGGSAATVRRFERNVERFRSFLEVQGDA